MNYFKTNNNNNTIPEGETHIGAYWCEGVGVFLEAVGVCLGLPYQKTIVQIK
jgi:hypothetical protein